MGGLGLGFALAASGFAEFIVYHGTGALVSGYGRKHDNLREDDRSGQRHRTNADMQIAQP